MKAFVLNSSGLSPLTSSHKSRIVAALAWYIANKPDHTNGLCWWLSYAQPRDIGENGYDLIDWYRQSEHCSSEFRSAPGGYIDDSYGPTLTRLEFAAELLEFLRGCDES